ncbi:MAG: hypothetical protein WDN69_20785 [Aliidongia sp.]
MPRAVRQALIELTAKSLVITDATENVPYHRLLQFTRAYAVSKLHAMGDAHKIHKAHAEYHRVLLKTAEIGWSIDQYAKWLDRYGGGGR